MRKSSSATSSSTSSWATKEPSGSLPGDARLVKRPEAEFSAFFAYPSYMDAWRATGDFALRLATLAGVVLFDESPTCDATTRRTSRSPTR